MVAKGSQNESNQFGGPLKRHTHLNALRVHGLAFCGSGAVFPDKLPSLQPLCSQGSMLKAVPQALILGMPGIWNCLMVSWSRRLLGQHPCRIELRGTCSPKKPQFEACPYCGWTKSCTSQETWKDDSCVNTNEQWLPMVSKWCRISSIHSMLLAIPPGAKTQSPSRAATLCSGCSRPKAAPCRAAAYSNPGVFTQAE